MDNIITMQIVLLQVNVLDGAAQWFSGSDNRLTAKCFY